MQTITSLRGSDTIVSEASTELPLSFVDKIRKVSLKPGEGTSAKQTCKDLQKLRHTPEKDTPAQDTPAQDTPAKGTPAKDTRIIVKGLRV